MQRQYLPKPKTGSDNSPTQTVKFAPSAHPVLQLQAALGNGAVNHLLKRQQNDHLPAQAANLFRGLSHEFMQQSGGHPIAEGIRQSMEQRLNTDLSDVKVHTDEKADWLNRSLNSLAFTNQRDIFFRQNAYQPSHPIGQKLLAHELAHVMQQTQGQVQPTQQVNGVAVNHHPRLEQEADAIANQVMHTHQSSVVNQNHDYAQVELGGYSHPVQSLAAGRSQPVVQRMVIPKDAVGLEKDLDTESVDYPDEIKKIKDIQILEKIISYTQKHKKTPEDEWSIIFPSNQKEEIPNLIREIDRLANEAAISIGMKPSSDTEDLHKTVAEIIKESGYEEAINWLKLYIENSKKLPEAIEPIDKENRRLEEKLDDLLGKYGARATAEANKVNLGDPIEGKKITVDEKTKKLLGKTFKTKQEFGRPGKPDEPLGKQDNPFDFLKKKRKDKQDKLLKEQKQVKKDIKSPSLKINDKVTVDGAKVLKWFNEVTRVELSQFYDSTKAPAKAIAADRRRLENITLDSKNWLDAWAQLAWKDTWARANDHDYGKAKGAAKKTFPLIGKLNLGGKAYAVEDKLWVKPEVQDKATRYNVMGEELAKGKTSAKRAENIRKVIKGDLTGVDAHEQEAALAMLGAETARNPRSYGVGLMLLDMVENSITYGSGKHYTWDKILGSEPHPGESRKAFETRKTAATPEKSSRWAKMFSAVSTHAPQFEDKPFVSLWAGKWSMSPSASLSLGAPSLTIPAKAEDLNTVQYKELKTILNWYINLMQGVELDVKDETEAETVLKKLFQMRLQSTNKFTNEMLKQKDDWT